ncbi:hypothetical protein CH92_09930 [Stutzerimonas stutzeri]|uniref:Uncharacterized protein n=1 Tax=Stutzerimonas stutzeri TaxID=316 RepID=W8R3Y7_STUST|nr:hypothetical protein [Stutzerimonas stutzeri]AHL77635.1 hypothetical protein CH92_09930 [Stutzerimonas stutzeri]MCQ4328028.1 hypothetical protein [Stutzerimonas stutzeri]
MDITKMDTDDAGSWGVVYSYGSVLAVFQNEQDAQNEAASFGGAVVRIARDFLTAVSEMGATATLGNQSRPV